MVDYLQRVANQLLFDLWGETRSIPIYINNRLRKELGTYVYKEEIEVYGIAIDIGTTTLGFLLVDLQTGKIRGTYSSLNNQRMYGADVITRIQSAASG